MPLTLRNFYFVPICVGTATLRVVMSTYLLHAMGKHLNFSWASFLYTCCLIIDHMIMYILPFVWALICSMLFLVEHEVLEREIERLRTLYQQQQQQPHQQPPPSHQRARSRDLDSQFASLSLKHKDSSSGTDSVSGPLNI